ncbi:hypothetical protein [Bradyrhizobium sacchari]|nr:hypothetical protein [Bradyrhizobium sacchari]
MGKLALVILCAASVAGCASTQLNYNTLDIASSVSSLYTKQVLSNLSKYIDEPEGLPAQVDIAAGTVQTSNSVTPSITGPVSKSFTYGAAGLVTGSAAAGASMTGTFADSWQQNWNVSPITDANTLRNLRAIYRYAVYQTNIEQEYHVPRASIGGKLVANPYLSSFPQCVLCGPSHGRNPKLRGGWLYWTGPDWRGLQNPPPADVPVVSLGHYGAHELFMLKSDFDRGYLADFTLFVLPVSEPSLGGGTGGGSAPSRHNFNILVPQQILPQQQSQ